MGSSLHSTWCKRICSVSPCVWAAFSDPQNIVLSGRKKLLWPAFWTHPIEIWWAPCSRISAAFSNSELEEKNEGLLRSLAWTFCFIFQIISSRTKVNDYVWVRICERGMRSQEVPDLRPGFKNPERDYCSVSSCRLVLRDKFGEDN